MNILYASNDGYARHLGVSLYSLYDHNRDIQELQVFVMSVEMNTDNQQKLQSIAKAFHRSITFVEMGNLEEHFTVPIDTRGFDISALTRLFAEEALPDTVEKVLYLDCDTVILGSIEALDQTDFLAHQGTNDQKNENAKPDREYLAAMVQEPTVYQEMKETIDFMKDDAYYNSGVILMNLKAWREEHIQQRMLQFYVNHGGNLFACDQDTINGALKGRILNLPPKYNFFTNYRYFPYRTLTGLCKAYEAVSEQQFEEAGRRPVIIHYMGDERPWIAGNHNHYRKYYEVYLSRTPWAGTPKETGKELYMAIYCCMNQVTRICPPIREMISRHFGMKVIDARKK